MLNIREWCPRERTKRNEIESNKPPASSSLRYEETTPSPQGTLSSDFIGIHLVSGGVRWFMKFLFILYVFSLLWTISRGAWLGVGVQVFLLIWFFKPQRKRYLGWIVLVWVVLMVWVSWMKSGSTIGHGLAWQEWCEAFLANPWWYGLGSAGPAVHRDGIYLPENHYLQILLDIGIPWLLLWLGVLGSIVYKTIDYRLQITGNNVYIVLLIFWLIGLLVEGLFLHVFEDSMVNYMFLVVLGISLGNLRIREN